jgi:putative ferrous iron transport protein C
MLLEIKRYMSAKKTANLQELVLHFKKQPDMIRFMLQHWIRKGKICCVPKPVGCGSQCQMCKPSIVEIYSWND